MEWNFEEALSFYKSIGAPSDQNALIGLLREIQQENGNSIPDFMAKLIAEAYVIKESYLLAIIKRIPSLRLNHQHLLEVCSGSHCGKHVALIACIEKLQKHSSNAFSLKIRPCMRMCGKGPNIKWDGIIYHNATEALIKQLLSDAKIEI